MTSSARRVRIGRTSLLVGLAGLLLVAGREPSMAQRPAALRLAVVNTPDVLLARLIQQYERETGQGVTMQITEGVYELARRGMADLVIAHYGHAGTEAFITDGLGRWPRMVFSNQAALVGPGADPAAIRGLADAAAAFRFIAHRGGEFLVNNASTEKYLAEVLWEAAGRPPRTGWYVDLGLRDQAAVQMAAQRGAYTLWGLVPFVRLRDQQPLGMEVLVQEDPLFHRVMVSVVVNPDRVRGVQAQAAEAFQRFLTEPRTQAAMRSFRHHELLEQTWWPAARNNDGAYLSQF